MIFFLKDVKYQELTKIIVYLQHLIHQLPLTFVNEQILTQKSVFWIVNKSFLKSDMSYSFKNPSKLYFVYRIVKLTHLALKFQ
jgi:hypothetical protein